MPLIAPLVYYFGHKSPDGNPGLYRALMEAMGQVVRFAVRHGGCWGGDGMRACLTLRASTAIAGSDRMKADAISRTSGCIINTCGWTDGIGLQLLFDAQRIFEANIVVCVDQDRLVNDMRNRLGNTAHIIKLPKSGGVVSRSTADRVAARARRTKEYFFGLRSELSPASTVVREADVKIFKIGGASGPVGRVRPDAAPRLTLCSRLPAPPLPMSCLPIGSEPPKYETQLVPIEFDAKLQLRVLGVSSAETEADIVTSPVLGFIHVYARGPAECASASCPV